jgi:HEAT repeat protein
MRGEVAAVHEIVDHLRKVAAPRSGALDWVRAQAVLAIGRILAENPGARRPGDLSFTVATLSRGKSANVRRSAAIALGYLAAGETEPDAAAVKALVAKLRRGKDRLTRGFAAISLGRLGGDDALAALTRGLRREKGQLGVFCGIALGILAADAEERSREKAGGKAAQATDAGRSAHRERIGQRRTRAIQHLRAAFTRKRAPDQKAGLAIALGIAHDRESGAMILKALKASSDRRFRGDCAVALGMVAHTEAADTLLRIMKHADADPRLREHAAVGLGLMGSRRVVRPLLDALRRDQSHYALVAITQALGLVGDRSAVVPLAELAVAKKLPTYTRTYACWALGGIGDPRSLPALTPVRSHHNYHACCVNLNAMLVLIDL